MFKNKPLISIVIISFIAYILIIGFYSLNSLQYHISEKFIVKIQGSNNLYVLDLNNKSQFINDFFIKLDNQSVYTGTFLPIPKGGNSNYYIDNNGFYFSGGILKHRISSFDNRNYFWTNDRKYFIHLITPDAKDDFSKKVYIHDLIKDKGVYLDLVTIDGKSCIIDELIGII